MSRRSSRVLHWAELAHRLVSELARFRLTIAGAWQAWSRSPSAREPVRGLEARDRFIAGSAICAALLLPMPERPKQKRDARRDHDCGVCAWVIAATSCSPGAWLLDA